MSAAGALTIRMARAEERNGLIELWTPAGWEPPVLHVIANPHAGTFYDACGFEPLGEVRTAFGAGRAMCKKLST